MQLFHHAEHHGTPEQLLALLKESGHLESKSAQQFCDEACLNRYLRARSHDVSKAAAMLRATLEWRQRERIDDLTAAEFADTPFMREGWVYVVGNDAAGRSIVMFRKRKDKFPLHLEGVYLRFMAFVVEAAIKNMKGGAEQWVWLLDLAVYSSANAPHMSVTLGVLNMLANHYPERLHKAYICNAPTIFNMGWRMISPFVDPVSKSKVEFLHTADYEPGGGSHGAGKAAAAGGGHWWSGGLHLPGSAASSSGGGASSSSSGGWSSWFHSSSGGGARAGSSSGGGSSAAAADAQHQHHQQQQQHQSDVDANVTIGGAGAGAKDAPSVFGPQLLNHYNTQFCPDKYRTLLTAAGVV